MIKKFEGSIKDIGDNTYTVISDDNFVSVLISRKITMRGHSHYLFSEHCFHLRNGIYCIVFDDEFYFFNDEDREDIRSKLRDTEELLLINKKEIYEKIDNMKINGKITISKKVEDKMERYVVDK